MRPAPLTLASALALLPLASTLAQAQPNPSTQTVVVTGSVRAQQALDTPFAIGSVDAQALRDGGPLINLSEALNRVPGLVVANRNNYAQDLQISSRGFGARATFGVRGLRLYSDGIPASGPDGQGQVAHFDLAGADRVEVLRGPFSVLYGASSGGVVAVFSAPVKERRLELAGDIGRFGLGQLRASVAAPLGDGLDIKLNLASMAITGFRPQSAASRDLANVRLGWRGAADTVVLAFSQHEQQAQDPLGLSAAEFAANPRGTTPNALVFNTRKTISQGQLGASWRHAFADGSLLRESTLAAYLGRRAVVQYLAIAPNVQAPARHGGGVVDFDRAFSGVEGRLRGGTGALEWQLGATLDRQRDERRGWENFVGTTLGVQGNLRRDETNRATTRDLYAQAEWEISPALAATGGVRTGRTSVRVQDRYVQGLNGDDSGSLTFKYTNPVLGLRWKPTPQWALHLSAARGYETPTLGELAYTADNSGFNVGLKGQESRQFELGSKWRSGALEVDAALFLVDTDNEIGVRSNSGGRSSFQNVGRTRRHGAELSALWRLGPTLRAQASLTGLHAQYLDSFDTCTGTPCTVTPRNNLTPVPAGNRIAGTQARMAWAELAWAPGLVPGEFAVEARGQSRTAANDLGTVFAPGFGLLNLRWRHDWKLGEAGTLQTLVRVDNLANRAHVGSVIVNDANSRFFEPGAPRSWLLSLRWAKLF